MERIFGITKLNAIILAAGEGKRLRPLTNDRPKCLVNLFGKNLLEWQIRTFSNCGIKDITVVKGFKAEMIKSPNVKCVKNENFSSTNMVETLFCAEDTFSDSIVISYGDIIFEPDVLNLLIKSDDDFSVVIDKNWLNYWKIRFENPIDDAESLSLDNDLHIIDIGQKESNVSKIQGQYIGLMKFQKDGIRFAKDFYRSSKKKAKNGINPLNPNCKFEKSYLTDFIRGLINEGCKIKGIPINGGWLELDSINDYEVYNKMWKDRTLDNFINIGKM